jgi:GNAT superfamily N-acetyltransferase
MTQPSQSIVVAPAAEKDMTVLLRMIRREAEFEKLTEGFTATEQGLREGLFSSRPAAQAIIAFDGNDPVGFAIFFTTFSTFQAETGLYLEDLFVEEKWRSKGVGRKLLAHLANEAILRQCNGITWSVLKWNERAVAFYRSIGAEQLEAWHHFHLSKDALTKLAGAIE